MTLGIQVENLSLRYGETTALDNLSFTLTGGRIYGLLGRNGSGKTSLLSVLAGFRRASEGAVLIDGQSVFENPVVSHQTCLIRETGDAVDASERVKEVLRVADALRPSFDADYASALAERFELPLDKKVRELSRGKKSALGIILGLASRAPVTMFDESHLGMDAPSRGVFLDELVADFGAHPRTIVLSTHLVEEFSSLFEEVVIIDRGKLVLHDDADALRSRGATVTGPADEVDRFVGAAAGEAGAAQGTRGSGVLVLSEKQLGRTKATMVYGPLDDTHHEQARDAGLDLEPVGLQELFVHLTAAPAGGTR